MAQVTFSECLDECNRGNVVVVRACALARRQGARPVWFERLAGDELTDALMEWLRAGAVGLAALPQPLESRVVDRGGAAASEEPSRGL